MKKAGISNLIKSILFLGKIQCNSSKNFQKYSLNTSLFFAHFLAERDFLFYLEMISFHCFKGILTFVYIFTPNNVHCPKGNEEENTFCFVFLTGLKPSPFRPFFKLVKVKGASLILNF